MQSTEQVNDDPFKNRVFFRESVFLFWFVPKMLISRNRPSKEEVRKKKGTAEVHVSKLFQVVSSSLLVVGCFQLDMYC